MAPIAKLTPSEDTQARIPQSTLLKSMVKRCPKTKLCPVVDSWAAKYVARNNLSIVVADHNKLSESNWNRSTLCAPYINGTACCGKSTLVRKINKRLADLGYHHHETSDGPCDGNDCTLAVKPINFLPKKFAEGKDVSLIRAMGYQLSFFNLGLEYYSLVGDRCPLNNLIWRFIMMLVGLYNKDVPSNILHSTLVQWMDTVPDALWESCKVIPTIIVIDPDCDAVRARMIQRNTGSDVMRAGIAGYVECQNLCYLELARRCGYQIWIMAEDTTPLEEMVVDKIKDNINKRGGPKFVMQTLQERFTIPAIDESELLQDAQRLGMLK